MLIKAQSSLAQYTIKIDNYNKKGIIPLGMIGD